MGKRHAGVFPLVILAALVSVTAAGICPYDDWQYHDRTGTCMYLNLNTMGNYAAEYSCNIRYGGSNRNISGHLVRIFDKETDEFVKELLKKQKSVSQALIGLQDREENGVYYWGDGYTRQSPGYLGWKQAPKYPDGDTSKSSVVITREGWLEYNKDTGTQFVCQVMAVFPKPTVDCPVAEAGHRDSSIKCTVVIPQDVTVAGLTIKRYERDIVSCKSYTCIQGPWTSGNTTWSLASWFTEVERSYEGSWSCSVKLSNGHESESSPCNFQVYTVPANVVCKESFVKSKLEVSCTTGRMYPRAACNWDIKTDQYTSNKVEATYPSISSTEEYYQRIVYYRSVCSVSLDVTVAGVYLFRVSVYPDLPGLEKFQPSMVKTGSLNVSVEKPEAPIFYDSTWSPLGPQLVVFMSQTITINCRIDGGIPPVCSTTISCYLGHTDNRLGIMSSMNIRIIQDLHQRTCICLGQHLSGVTSSSSVTFLVISAPKVTYFSINSQQDKVEVSNSSLIDLLCTSTGYPYQLSLLYDQDNKETIKTENNTLVTHQMSATCSSMGRYSCVAENTINNVHNKDVKYVHLSVQCALEHCPHKGPFPKYGVAVGLNSSFKICVRGCPAPTSVRLINDTTKDPLKKSLYEASFHYTDKDTGLADITVTIFSFTQQDLGRYELYSEIRERGTVRLSSYLKFELIPRGRPSCPKNLTVSKTLSDSVTLSWKPGFDGGAQQTFTVLRYVSSLTAEPHPVSGIAPPTGNSKAVMTYNLTGLSASTKYMFVVQPENHEGVRNCSHLWVESFTEASPLSSSDQNLTTIVVPVVVGLILVLLVVVVVVFVIGRRRRRSQEDKLAVINKDAAQTSTIRGDSSRMNDGQETFYANLIGGNSTAENPVNRNTDGSGHDNTYAQVSKSSKKKESKGKNRAKRSTNESGQDNTYAQVNKQNKHKAQKESKGKNLAKRSTNESEQDNTYAQVNKPNKKKAGKEKQSNEKEENNEEATYSVMSKHAAAKTGQEANEGSFYVNVPSSSKTEHVEQSKARDDGRTVNQDGLIYAEVTINKKTTNPVIIGHTNQPHAKVAIVPVKPREPAVEYISIDFAATTRHK